MLKFARQYNWPGVIMIETCEMTESCTCTLVVAIGAISGIAFSDSSPFNHYTTYYRSDMTGTRALQYSDVSNISLMFMSAPTAHFCTHG